MFSRVSAIERIAVVGGGTMGAGIAALACRAGIPTVLCDLDEAAVAAGARRAHAVLEDAVVRGKLSVAEVERAAARLTTASDLAVAATGCSLVLEAVPERLELKRELLGTLARAAPGAVLASNTSSLSIADLAQGLPAPEQLVGLHFFNPPAAMRLVEVVATPRTDPVAVATARALAEATGKTVVEVADGPGFLVNRCARPYYLEALRIVEDGVASPAEVDRVCRLGGGFPMGPFELMDLVGIDVGLAATRSMWEQSFGEPRWRPSPLQVRMVAAGSLGRKSGRGFRTGEEAAGEPSRACAAPPRAIAVLGADALASQLRERAGAQGVALVTASEAELCVATSSAAAAAAPPGAPLLVSCGDAGSTTRRERAACGFQLVLPLAASGLVELARGPWTDVPAAQRAEALFGALGFAVAWVQDAPGLVLGRIVAQLVNEAWFAVAAGVAPADEVDRAMTLGLGYPRGPLAWGGQLGPGRVVALLDALLAQEGDPRYRVAPTLRRAALAER